MIRGLISTGFSQPLGIWDNCLHFPTRHRDLNLGRPQFLESMFSVAIARSFVALLPLSSEGACRCEGYGKLYSNSLTLARILNPRPQPFPALPMMCSSMSNEEHWQAFISALSRLLRLFLSCVAASVSYPLTTSFECWNLKRLQGRL